MIITRPAELDDLERIYKLAKKRGPGLTNFPLDKKLLEQKIQASINSFAITPNKPGTESYLFILEAFDSNEIIGISEIWAKTGGFEPFYSYKIKKSKHESKELGVFKEVDALHLTMEHNGPTEIGTLFVDPEYRHLGLGRTIALSRFLFIADNLPRFEEKVIAELRGVSDENGYSLFWDKVVRHFFDMEFIKADKLSVKDKRFIADLMPKHPIYIPILPEETQAVIGKVHKHTEPGLKLLYQEGFSFDGHVDIFDAGPRISCKAKDIRTIKDSRILSVKDIIKDQKNSSEQNKTTKEDKSTLYLISNCSNNFRSCVESFAEKPQEHINLSYKAARALKVNPEDKVRVVELYAQEDQTLDLSKVKELILA